MSAMESAEGDEEIMSHTPSGSAMHAEAEEATMQTEQPSILIDLREARKEAEALDSTIKNRQRASVNEEAQRETAQWSSVLNQRSRQHTNGMGVTHV